MAPSQLPPSVADTMVRMLFRETTPFAFRELLLVGDHLEQLDAAVNRYVEDEAGDRPDTYISTGIGTEGSPDTIDGTLIDGTFLSETFDIQTRFEYILGVPAALPWTQLSTEQRRDIAGFSPHVEPDDTAVDPSVLYMDRATPLLNGDGRAVFLGQHHLKTADQYTGFRDDLSARIRDVEAVDAFDEQWFALAAEKSDDEPFDIDERAVWADPSVIEQLLSESATNSRNRWTVGDVMVPLSEMKVYGDSEEASKVYLDLLYEDFDGSLIYEDPANRDGFLGCVARHELTIDGPEPIREHTQSVTDERCIGTDQSLYSLIQRLADSRFLFAGKSDDICGIVTRYDLNRLPVYHWLYDRFASLEVELRGLIRQSEWSYEESDVRLRGRGAGDLVPDRLANDTLSKLVTIIEEANLTSEVVDPNRRGDVTLDDLVYLRNAVAHYNVLVHTMSDRTTLDDDERGAEQLAREVALLVEITWGQQ